LAVNVIGDLPQLKWRGLAAPCESATYSGSHSQAERRYPYIDAAGHDWTGRDPYQFAHVRLHFLNTIKPGDWYPAQWNSFREALENGDSGALEHPDLGTVRARVVSWEVALTAQNRGGIVVDVSFVETVDNLDERVVYLGPDVTPTAVAEAADDAMATLGVPYPDGTGSTSLLDGIKSIEGQLFSATLSVKGAINQMVGTVEGLIKTVNAINDHVAYLLYGHLITLWNALQQMGKSVVETQRATAVFRVVNDTTIDALGRELGNTVQELIGLNLSLVNRPNVPPGTNVRYYTGGVSISSPLRKPGP